MAQRREDERPYMADTADADDDELINAAETEPDAFAVLYGRYHHRVYAYVLARVASVDDAADLTQYIFLRAFDVRAQRRGGVGSFAPWLFTIARNAVVDHYRRRRGTISWSQLPEPLQPSNDEDAYKHVAQAEDLARLRRILLTLSDEQRELLALRFAARLTASEISIVIGKTPEATQKQITRILQRVKEHYHADHEQ
jgi:RNA polymerase sigma-70 factor (ECF subfamily)